MQHPFRAEVACFSAASDKNMESESGALHYKVLAFSKKKAATDATRQRLKTNFQAAATGGCF